MEDLLQPATNHTSACHEPYVSIRRRRTSSNLPRTYVSHTSQRTSAEDLLQPATNHTSAYASMRPPYVSIRQHVPACVSHTHSIRQHTSAYVSMEEVLLQPGDERLPHASAIRQHTSAMRQHTPAYVRIPGDERLAHASAIRQHTSAIRQHTYAIIREDTWRRAPDALCPTLSPPLCAAPAAAGSAAARSSVAALCTYSIRQHTSAYVSIRLLLLVVLLLEAPSPC